MKYQLMLILLLSLLSCRYQDFSGSLSIKGRIQTINGTAISDVKGRVCVELIMLRKGHTGTERVCTHEMVSSVDGTIYADLYPAVKEKLWFWQSKSLVQLVDYRVSLHSDGKVIRGEFPEGKRNIEELLGQMEETVVNFKLDRLGHDKDNFYNVEYLSNYDGDTVTFNIPGVHALLGQAIPIRVNGVQTPELRTSDQCEKNSGYFVKKEIESLLKNATRIDLLRISRGKYFRIVADVKATFKDGSVVDLGDFILKNRYGVAYDGDTKPIVDWCQFPGN